MCLSVKNGGRMEKVADGYASVVNQRRLEKLFAGWKSVIKDLKQQSMLKKELVEVSNQLKNKSILSAAFEAIKSEKK